MKIQYFGDVNDYRKFALLRLFARQAKYTVGVCWMMSEPDERQDGNNRRYRERPDIWRGYDPELFDALKTVPNPPSKVDLQKVESKKLIRGAIYFENQTPDSLTERKKFHGDCMTKLAAADLVFFDPDNGLEVRSRPKGRKGSNKFVYHDEIADYYSRGQSVLVYQHFPREQRAKFLVHASSSMGSQLNAPAVWSFETAHAAFLLAAQPAHAAEIQAAAQAIEDNKWTPRFFKSLQRREQVVRDEEAERASLH
jgi:hypothetical protein